MRKIKMKKYWKIILFFIVVVLLVADFMAVSNFFEVSQVRNDDKVGQVKKDSPNYSLVEKFDQLEKVEMTMTHDNLEQKAWYVPAEKKTNQTVIVVHGYRSDKTAMRQYGQLFHELGYNVLMPDNRAAGESEGQLISYGFWEKYDLISWANQLVADTPTVDITLFGLSMGAATVMMASSEESLPSNVQRVIEDCGYSNVWDETVYQGKQMYDIPTEPFLYQVSAMSKIRDGWFYQEADVMKALAKNELPILLIHGDKDDYVPTAMLTENYNAVKKGTAKEKLLVKGAEHAKSFETNPELYRQTISAFLKKY
ncbi:MAG: alpha/beta hydrolase [Lactovum sp.]